MVEALYALIDVFLISAGIFALWVIVDSLRVFFEEM